MVKLHGSVLLASAGTVTGNGALDATADQNGKFTFISNMTAATATAASPSLVSDGAFETAQVTNDAVLDAGNSFDNDLNHPKIGELDSGADTEGILSGTYWNETDVTTEATGTPRLELVILDGDQSGDVYDGYDQIFLINNTGATLNEVSLDVPGGLGLTLIPNTVNGELGATEIFTTTVPDGVVPTLGPAISFTDPTDQLDVPITDNATFSVTGVDGMGDVTYQWQVDTGSGFADIADGALGSGAVVSGATTDTLTITGVTEDEDGYEFRVVMTDNIQEQNSGSALLTINAAVVVTLQTGSTSSNGNPLDDGFTAATGSGGMVYQGTPFQLGVIASGGLPQSGGSPTYSYDWKLNGGDSIPNLLGGENDTILIQPAAAGNTGTYTVIVSDGQGGSSDDTSDDIVVTVVSGVSVTNPVAAQTVNVGNDATFSVTASNGIPPYSYEWYKDGAGPIVDGPNVTGATTNTLVLTVTSGTDAADYTCKVIDSGCGDNCSGGNETSGAGALTVTNDINSLGPDDVNAYTGEAVTPSLDVVGGFSPYTVEWYKLPDTVTAIETDGPSAGPTFTLDALGTADSADEGDYRAVISDGTNPDYTTPDFTVTVQDLPQVTDPDDVFVYDGGTANFSVTASEGYGPYSYDWRQGGVSLGAADQATLALPVTLADDGTLIDVVVSDAGGDTGSKSVTSGTATVNVAAALSVGAPLPEVKQYNTEGPVSVSSLVSGGFAPLTYEWVLDIPGTGEVDPTTLGAISSGDTLDYTPVPGLEVQGTIRLEVTDDSGTTVSPSTPFQLANPLTLNGPLEDATAPSGQPFAFDAEPLVDGGIDPLMYQWEDGSKAVLSGETNSTLEFNPLTFADAGQYRFSVTDSHPSPTTQTSNYAILTVVEGVPVAGALGLGALAVAGALGGALALRRRRN
jgi:hypothetical protein